MTTDITELAQREKFEAWAEEGNALPWGYLKKRRIYTGFYSEHTYTSLWAAWKAAGAELVEALEKSQRYIERLREWNAGLAQESCERQQLISELEPIRAAAEKLVRCKGRYHSEQNYRVLAALFGVNTPDLPPLEHENVHYADAAEMEIAALRLRIAELEKSELQLIDERDIAEEALSDMYQAATGERPEWSNMFGFADAVDAVEHRLGELESRTVTVKLASRRLPSDYVDGEFCNDDLAAIHNACRLECKVSVEKYLSAHGIVVKWGGGE